MKRTQWTALLLLLCLLTGLLSGCAKRSPEPMTQATETTTEAPETTTGELPETTTEAPETTTEAPETTTEAPETTTEAPEEALYARFSEVLEANDKLGDYREFVYNIFPVIADNMEYLDEEYFFSALAKLSISVADLDDSKNGEFWFGSKELYLNETMLQEKPYIALHALFHELMHFVDYSINGDPEPVYLLDGKHLHLQEAYALSPQDYSRAIFCEDAQVVTEGGAELFAAKYYGGAPNAYFPSVTFLTGLEYILGEDYINALFLRWDSDGLLEELFLEMGYTQEEYQRVAGWLNSLTRGDLYSIPENPVSLEDVLIDVYEYKLGDGWREDAGFLYILKCLNGIALDDWKNSKHADFLETIEFKSFPQYEAFQGKLFSEAKEVQDLDVLPPTPFMRDGKLLLGAFATLKDPQTGEEYHGTVTFDYDFETETLRSYEIKNTTP